MRLCLKSRIIVYLCVDTIYKLGYRQLYERCLQQLLMRNRLPKLQLLCLPQFLYLTVFIAHYL